VRGWRGLGLDAGRSVVVHSSLSGLGRVEGGAGAVVDSLVRVVGPEGTVVVPTFTPYVADPAPEVVGVPDAEVRARRDAVPAFHADLPSTTGAVPEALRSRADAVRSDHPQASFAAVGRHAADITAEQPLSFALGPGSPFDRLHDLDGAILLVGVGHDRNSYLHHAEGLTPAPRLKLRRFPLVTPGGRVWCEALDVGDDNGVHFPAVGREFERAAGVRPATVGRARCVLLPIRPFVDFAARRLAQLLPARPPGRA